MAIHPDRGPRIRGPSPTSTYLETASLIFPAASFGNANGRDKARAPTPRVMLMTRSSRELGLRRRGSLVARHLAERTQVDSAHHAFDGSLGYRLAALGAALLDLFRDLTERFLETSRQAA